MGFGRSPFLGTKLVVGEEALRQWMAERNVIVKDIKFSFNQDNQPCFFVVYWGSPK